MTDEQLIARMRQVEWEPCQLAADRIEQLLQSNEALVKARREDALELLAASGQAQEAYEAQLKAEARAKQLVAKCERLEKAMIQMRDDRTAFRHAVHFRRFITTILKGDDHE